MDDNIYSPNMGNIPDQQRGTEKEATTLSAHIIDFIQTFVVFGAIFALIYWQVSQPHKVSGSSMVPNFHDGDYILTDKVTYKFSTPKRGDIIVLKNPRDETQDFIKRIIGLPGDTVTIERNSISVNNERLDEKYLPSSTSTHGGSFLHEGSSVTVDPDNYFVSGDNRDHSSDSREWGFVPRKDIIGRVFFRYWPITSLGLIQSCCLLSDK